MDFRTDPDFLDGGPQSECMDNRSPETGTVNRNKEQYSEPETKNSIPCRPKGVPFTRFLHCRPKVVPFTEFSPSLFLSLIPDKILDQRFWCVVVTVE